MKTATIATVFLLVIVSPGQQAQHVQITRFIPTSEVVRVASMAARDEGYNPNREGTYLDELRSGDGKEPYDGYTSIGLYHEGHLVREYAIRVETGDVIDPMYCKVFRYPNLLRFRAETMRGFATKPVSLERLAEEVGCENLTVVSKGVSHRKATEGEPRKQR